MPKIKSGISQVGGKFRLCNTILPYIPYHEFFLSMFCGACWVELNKPRSRYECYNDLDAEIMNYLIMIERYPEEFDLMKQGVYGLVSQEMCNRIVRGELKPRNDLERAYYFYYLNKLTFGGDVQKVGKDDEAHAHQGGIMRPTDPCRQPQVEKIKQEWETKGYIGLIDNQTMSRDGYGRVDANVVEKAKKQYKGLQGAYHQVRETDVNKARASFAGINNTIAGNNASNMRDMDKWKEEFKETVEGVKAKYKGVLSSGSGRVGNSPGRTSSVGKAKERYKDIVEDAKFRGVVLPTVCKEKTVDDAKGKARYSGINIHGAVGLRQMSHTRETDIAKKQYKENVEDAKFRGVVLPTVCKEKSVNEAKDEWKSNYRGIPPPGFQGKVDKAKESYKIKYRGIPPKQGVDTEEVKSSYNKVALPMVSGSYGGRGMAGHKGAVDGAKATFKGIANHEATGWGTLESGEVNKAKQQYQAVSYKGLNPKTTRPYHNNDCGLLTPLDKKAIERLRYVNLTCYEFKRVYKLFYNAFHVRKGLGRECFVYADPPYPSTEKYYGDKFQVEDHQHLIDLMLETPFNFMLSIGGKCEMYLEQLSDWVIVPVDVRYSTDANSQKKSREYIIMNYSINEIGNMQQDVQSSLSSFF